MLFCFAIRAFCFSTRALRFINDATMSLIVASIVVSNGSASACCISKWLCISEGSSGSCIEALDDDGSAISTFIKASAAS
uniref:Putative secreted protein n=1 Tax=Anopheles darlingi TaxID=43151 RepID=A0A2M4D969_ANODA